MKNIDSDLIRGNIDTIILTTMLDGDKYGLDIIKEVETRSNGTYELKQPTLYSCLKRLENQELISSYWLDSDIGGRRHYYKLTEKGKASLLQKQEEWAKSKFIIDNLLSNHDYDEYRLVKKEDYDKIIEGKQFEYKPEQTAAPQESVESPADDKVEIEESNTEEFVEESDEQDEEELLPVFDESDEVDDYFDEDEVVEDSLNEDDVDDVQSDEPEYKLTETEYKSTRIDYGEDDESEKDYPNQKRFKIPSIYDKINIDDAQNEEFDDEDDDKVTNSIYSDNVSEDEEEDEETEDFNFDELDLDENSIDEDFDSIGEDEEDSSNEDEYVLGETEDESVEDSRTYFTHYEEPDDEDDDLNIAATPVSDQSQNELNILSRLRMQDDEEINEYVGDKNSYINHLNQTDDIENLKRDDLTVVQEDLLSNDNYLSDKNIYSQINELSSAIDQINNFNSESYEEDYEDEFEDNQEVDSQIEEELIDNTNNQEESKTIIDFKQDNDEDDFMNDLEDLKDNNQHGFFNSLDSAEYSRKQITNSEPAIKPYTFDSLPDFGDDSEDSSDAAFNKQFEDYNNQFGYNKTETYDPDNSYYDESDSQEENYSLSSFDDIISKTASSYTADTTSYLPGDEYQTFTPRFTENNYKQKLNNLSAYSKVNQDEEEVAVESVESNDEVMSKVKDIQTLKAEFADEGISVKEYKKTNGHDDYDRTYLLINKLNLVKSLILLFGYVFILSAVYIIMNNTTAANMHNFSFKYFLYGFIPFAVYALIYLVLFILNPYKKIPAKFAARIMIFISVIITIQLLLITYCVNLQLGFYSFAQSYYNHLIWIIPTVISFAPIVSTLIHIALYYSKNFNV